MARSVRRRRHLLDAAGVEPDRSAAHRVADVRRQDAAHHPDRTAQGEPDLLAEAAQPLPSRVADATDRAARRGRQRIRDLDADALCRNAQRRPATLRRLGHPHADRHRRQAEDPTEAHRHRQLRRRVRQHPAIHVTQDVKYDDRMASGTIRKSYDGVVACLPVTIPYRRYSTNSAHWWLGRALHELVSRAGLRPTDIDGFAVSSFTVGPDTAVGLTQHFGLSPRWLDHIPFGGASGIVALRRAARAVQAGDAEIVACVAADTNHVDSFRKTLSTFSRFAQDAVYPYGSGGANGSFALITKNYMNSYGARREDFAKLCIAQRDNALSIPHALMKKKLTLDEYMSARPIADPIHLF